MATLTLTLVVARITISFTVMWINEVPLEINLKFDYFYHQC
jgi:hypothetical protein